MDKIIALDIDGTLTAEKHAISMPVIEALIALEKSGWNFIFATGRPFSWAHQTLGGLPFPYALTIQNGALTLAMPSQKILDRCYIGHETIVEFSRFMQAKTKGFGIYGGYEGEDRCYYFPKLLSAEDLRYVQLRCKALQEEWIALNCIEELPLLECSALKSFFEKEDVLHFSKELEEKFHFHAPAILDPFTEPTFTPHYVVQITAKQADKGLALKRYVEKQKSQPRALIVAGNDRNDLPLFKHFPHAFKIAMSDSPDELKKLADFIAPSASVDGILHGLEKAKETLQV